MGYAWYLKNNTFVSFIFFQFIDIWQNNSRKHKHSRKRTHFILGHGYLIFSFADLSLSIFLQLVGEQNKTIAGFPWFFSSLGIKNRRKTANYFSYVSQIKTNMLNKSGAYFIR